VGSTGNDTYIVNAAGDVVVENVGEGTDTVQSTVTHTLAADVENLTLTGASNVNGTGNGLGNTLTGNGGVNKLNGGVGNDMLDGGAGSDTLLGGGSNDTLVYDASDALVDGGAGTDRLRIDGSGAVLDLSGLSGTTIKNIEIVDLTGTGNNTLTVTAQQVLDLSSSSNTLTVDGNAGDIVNAGSGWTDLGVSGDYHQYTQSGATLLVDTDITQNIS
jgi:Ca2+-binding RTX toxin-like protein